MNKPIFPFLIKKYNKIIIMAEELNKKVPVINVRKAGGPWQRILPIGVQPYNDAPVKERLTFVEKNLQPLTNISVSIMPQWFKDSVIVWYDPKRQNIKNEEMKALKDLGQLQYLKDFSGNNLDMELREFDWTENSGINNTNYNGALIFNGINNYGISTNQPILTKNTGYTLISCRKIINNVSAIFSKRISKDNEYEGAFQIERFNDVSNSIKNFSFGKENILKINKEDITWCTSKSYNGQSINIIGDAKDTDTLTIAKNTPTDSTTSSLALYSMLLFNRDLTLDEINFVINYCIMSDIYIPNNSIQSYYTIPVTTESGKVQNITMDELVKYIINKTNEGNPKEI